MGALDVRVAGAGPPGTLAPTCRGGLTPPPTTCDTICVIVLTPCLIMDEEKYVLSWVSRNPTECHNGMLPSRSCLGVGSGAVLQSRQKPLHEVPQKGYVFQGMDPSCNQVTYPPSSKAPYKCAQDSKWCLDCAVTLCGTCLQRMKGVVCYHNINMRGCGGWHPPSLGGIAMMGKGWRGWNKTLKCCRSPSRWRQQQTSPHSQRFTYPLCWPNISVSPWWQAGRSTNTLRSHTTIIFSAECKHSAMAECLAVPQERKNSGADFTKLVQY